MDNMPLSAAILQSFPEGIAVIILPCALLGVKPAWRHVFLIAFLQALIAWVVRRSVPVYGMHTIILVITLALWLSWIAKIEIKTAFACGFLGIIILVLVEILIFPIVLNVAGVSFQEVIGDHVLRIVLPLPHELLLIALGARLRIKDISLYKLAGSEWSKK